MTRHVFLSLTLALLAAACTRRPSAVPATFADVAEQADLYPDYRDVTIPPNIAPLNFWVQDESADAFVVQLGTLVCGAGAAGKLDIDTTAWRELLAGARGADLRVDVYARRAGAWVHHPPFRLHVAPEDIDPYLSYRLIEPGYELYRQIGLYQRNLTNFDEQPIYENNATFSDQDNHCVNCHNFQNYDTERMLFHVRAAHGGTIVAHGTEARKIAISHDSILAAGVYPSWHPTEPLVAFSTNQTGQVFHLHHPEKIEVLDKGSDLLLYDADRNEVSNILRSTDQMETFPCWSEDGRRLYYCSARVPSLPGVALFEGELSVRYDSLLYDLYVMDFDLATRTFSEPRLELLVSPDSLSASVPRVSPDGRYLLYTLGRYGQFHIWHKSADLWVKDLHTGQAYPLTEANSPEAESYHTWSSNGRWIVFSSRREDGNFTRPYIAYFDREGLAHRPFLLPQRDPEYNLLLLKSYNVPELTRNPVRVSVGTLNHVVLHTEAETATYRLR